MRDPRRVMGWGGSAALAAALFASCSENGEDTDGAAHPSGGAAHEGGRFSSGGQSGSPDSGGEAESGASGSENGGRAGEGAMGNRGGRAAEGGKQGGSWKGTECQEPSGGPVHPYFEVPGATEAAPGDFFRLPFPNDIRRSEAGLDLAGFPTPGVGLLGVDPVALYLSALESESAWGADATTFFRFSGELDDSTLVAGSSLRFVDLSAPAGTDDVSPELVFHYSRERTRYVCDHWLGVRRPLGAPLLSGHTYAVWVSSEVKAANGDELEPAPDFVRLLGEVEPDDAALAHAYAAYEPLRDHLSEHDIDPSTLLTAAVFSVGDLQHTMQQLAERVEAEPPPAVTGDWVRCADGVESPCPEQSGGRACGSQAEHYDEYHAQVVLPSYQRGVPPFAQVADGGDIDLESPPTAVDVCLALTVPRGEAPPAGFPLIIFAHGTGGSFRSHVSADIAGAFATSDLRFAVLGIDQVSHGSRRGSSMVAPETLFFNFLNPAAARGNPLQGAADQLSLARFAETLTGEGNAPARIDAQRMVFFGHSQGATEGSLAAPYAERFRALVLSGNGGSLQRALLTKKKPLDLRATLPLLLSDAPLDDRNYPAEFHPVLSLVQHWIDPADPINFARSVALVPAPGHSARNAFQTYGLDDTYSPPVTQAAYAIAGGFAQVEPELAPLGLDIAFAPLSANINGATLGFRQYRPALGEDGHFVAFSVPEASSDVLRFVSTAVSGESPIIGE